MGCTWNSRNALRKIVSAKRSGAPRGSGFCTAASSLRNFSGMDTANFGGLSAIVLGCGAAQGIPDVVAGFQGFSVERAVGEHFQVLLQMLDLGRAQDNAFRYGVTIQPVQR